MIFSALTQKLSILIFDHMLPYMLQQLSYSNKENLYKIYVFTPCELPKERKLLSLNSVERKTEKLFKNPAWKMEKFSSFRLFVKYNQFSGLFDGDEWFFEIYYVSSDFFVKFILQHNLFALLRKKNFFF